MGDPPEPARIARLTGILSPAERDRLGRLVFEADRWHYLAAHVLLRRALSSFAPVPPEAWSVAAAEERGRPEIASPESARRLRFSLTHTRGLAACAVCLDRDVGVDAEAIDARLLSPEVAARFLSAAECEEVAVLPEERRAFRLLELWTLKEACLKARGDGLSVAPTELSFALAAGRSPAVSFGAAVSGDPTEWRFHLAALASGHVLAAAARSGAGTEVRFRARAEPESYLLV